MKRFFFAVLVGGVTFAGLSATGAMDDGINLGPLRLNIWGELTGTYDDNAKLVVPEGDVQERQIFENIDDGVRADQEDDIYYEGTLGLRLFRETESFFASIQGLYTARRYTDFDELDNESWGVEGNLIFGDREFDRLSLGLRGAYREVFDYETLSYPDDFTNPDTQGLFLSEDRTDRVSRQLTDLGAILTWQITEKIGSDYSISYGSIEYDTDLLFDWDDTKGQAEFDYKLTEKTSALLTGQYGTQSSDALDNDPDYYVLRGGFLTRSTDKLTFKGGAGFGSYDRFRQSDEALALDNAGEVDEQIEDESGGKVDYFSFDVAGDWDLSQRTKLTLIGRNAVQPAAQYNDNVKLVSVASIGIAHRFIERFRLAATVSYRLDDYEDPVELEDGTVINQEDEIWAGQLRLDYMPPNSILNLFAQAVYENRDTNIPNEDYDQVRLTLGVKIDI